LNQLSVVLLSGTIGDGWVSTRANLAKMPCAQNNNLIASFLAFCLSVGAVTIAVLEIGKVEEAFQSMGRGSPLRDASVRTVIQLCFSLLVNLVGFFNICLSTFHCESMMQFFFAHMATTSHAFCILRMISFTTLLVQLFLSSEILVGAGVALFLNFVCHLGSTTRFHVQEVIWEIGNFTKTGRDPFDPYRTGSMQEANSADTHFISVARLLQHLDLDHFCYFSGNLESSMTLFWLCSLASHVSQVLMTIALNGEKERVGVHEENDEAAQHGLSSEDGIALLSRGLNQGVSQSRMVMQDTASRAAAYAGAVTPGH